jgi:hypothetical protein
MARHQPHSSDLAPAEFFLSWLVLTMSPKKFKTDRDGVLQTITNDDFAKTIQW